jgi:hypothetical protein
MKKKTKFISIGKYFYIMKVIYIITLIEIMYIKVTGVQQPLNMGKCKYILKILKNWW